MRMRELQAEWRDRGLQKPFQLRIGINTGFCTVGNFGGEDRMDYTIIGSEVNLAARLESHAELGGILLSHETYSLIKDHVLAEERTPSMYGPWHDPPDPAPGAFSFYPVTRHPKSGGGSIVPAASRYSPAIRLGAMMRGGNFQVADTSLRQAVSLSS